ncbi:MAG: coenzyme F420-0:L-glutamate ligase [Candidatus Pacebacteria bacterium]|nr:coenzyme F420-0:L-glutamate ligase [Candidatus Paceibacterota bacterium]MCF7857080.1 coenzyme F420-0:L-glutamate ligase [Candidatus Paceibacterota bacterium]
MQIKPIKTSIHCISDDLFSFIVSHVKRLDDGEILVVTSKIVALSQGNIISHDMYTEYLKNVSMQSIQTPWATFTHTNEGWCINAGIDESNAQDSLITLPKKPFECAHALLKKLKRHYGLKNLGLIITDTRSVPLRVGTIGRTIGCAGFHPFKSYIGKKDLFGRKSRVTISNVADALAAGAVLVMGEGNEQTPLAVIQNAPITFTQSKLKNEETRLFLLPKDDIFTYLYKNASVEPHKHPKK